VFNCSSDDYGQFLYVYDPALTNHAVEYVTVLRCGLYGWTYARFGSVSYLELQSLNYFNFTKCNVTERGSAICAMNAADGTWSHLNVWQCSGLSMICKDTSGRVSVTFSGFYDNPPTEGVLYLAVYGISIVSCIFMNNMGKDAAVSQGFSESLDFTDCSFSGAFPNETLVMTTSCRSHATTATYSNVGTFTFYCPSPLALASASPGSTTVRSRSPLETPSVLFSDYSSFPSSRPPKPTSSFYITGRFVGSVPSEIRGICATPLFTPSIVSPAGSTVFAGSEPLKSSRTVATCGIAATPPFALSRPFLVSRLFAPS
jgi:hypothetical protein